MKRCKRCKKLAPKYQNNRMKIAKNMMINKRLWKDKNKNYNTYLYQQNKLALTFKFCT